MSFSRRTPVERRKDHSSFTLFKMNVYTGRELIDGQRVVRSARKAEQEFARLNAELSSAERAAGWKWAFRPNSGVARDRQRDGFHPGMN
jgi:hypothetical protein